MIKAKGKITLSGFSLEPAEKAIVNNLIQNYQSKIAERIGFEEISLRLKKARHGKTFLHEVHGMLIAEKRFASKATDYNLFAAISEVLEKLLHEAEHHQRTRRQRR